MRRSDGRRNAHIQERKPPSAGAAPAPPTRPDGEEQPLPEGRQAGWRWAAAIWAVMFLFLTTILVFDLIAGLWP
jgi:hypothetical protein